MIVGTMTNRNFVNYCLTINATHMTQIGLSTLEHNLTIDRLEVNTYVSLLRGCNISVKPCYSIL